ncbi:hypothetical protein MGU_05728 [Metarhizium guizhouense ARSEF 977]|uniref:NAD(P)-binding domain protein n=1 Tax=Metarhizium guizhouense (strain ARSEF 977) TaxID=1276136 RepID=A0A0B4GX07_METGA|nr:hypothetical protein MGU_05728 [Metarhizium guizhouense ARSEF 977]
MAVIRPRRPILISRRTSAKSTNARVAMHLILAGATGLVGSSVLSRKPVPVTHNTQNPHINIIIIHHNFERYDALAAAVGVTAVRLACRIVHLPTEHLGSFMAHMAVGSLDDKLQGAGVFKLAPSWIVETVGSRRIMGL